MLEVLSYFSQVPLNSQGVPSSPTNFYTRTGLPFKYTGSSCHLYLIYSLSLLGRTNTRWTVVTYPSRLGNRGPTAGPKLLLVFLCHLHHICSSDHTVCQERKGKRSSKQSYEEKGVFGGTKEERGDEMVCGGGARELAVQELLSVNRTICATGTVNIHTPDAWLFVGSPYYELKTRRNPLWCQSDTSGEIPVRSCLRKNKRLAWSQKIESKLRTLYI